MPAINFQTQSKIYRLTSTVDCKTYIGSTTSPLDKRLAQHRSMARRHTTSKVYAHFNSIGWEHVSIDLIEQVTCANRFELRERERHWVETLKPRLNSNIPNRTVRQWYQDNRDKQLAYQKCYYNKHKGQLLEYQKQRYHANKGDILARAKEKYAADNTYHRDYYRRNREKLQDYAHRYYINVGSKVHICQCGSVVQQASLRNHLKSHKHATFLESERKIHATQMLNNEFLRMATVAA